MPWTINDGGEGGFNATDEPVLGDRGAFYCH